MFSKWCQVVAAIMVAGLGSVSASADADFIKAFKACKAEADSVARLACFDRLEVGDVRRSAVAVQKSAEDEFGAEDLDSRHKANVATRAETMTAKILEAGTTRSGKSFFILENGQMWRQIKADTSKFRLPKNFKSITVTIERKSLGAHVLRITGKSRKVKVRRIR